MGKYADQFSSVQFTLHGSKFPVPVISSNVPIVWVGEHGCWLLVRFLLVLALQPSL